MNDWTVTNLWTRVTLEIVTGLLLILLVYAVLR